MVSKYVSGRSINGALNYNEQKVRDGKAKLLYAENFLRDAEALNYHHKLSTLETLAIRNERSNRNCVHISLNFDPSEQLDKDKLLAIAQSYMERIGFGEQPYLVYEHYDAAHQHLHILSTNIRWDGTRIDSQNIGKGKSESARKAIEKEFNLIPADGRKQKELLHPVAEAVLYGKSETKAAISNVVRTVAGNYKVASLEELNAVLGLYNVTAYRGEEGTRMYERKGLTYSVLDKNGNRVGVPIKASSIYTRPTLKALEKNFEQHKNKPQAAKDRLKKTIDGVLLSQAIPDKEILKALLKEKDVDVIYRQNELMVYGITYIDHNTKTVFNGSALGKDYSAKRILERIGKGYTKEQQQYEANKQFTDDILKQTDYQQGVPAAIASWYEKGLRIRTTTAEDGITRYYLGNKAVKDYLYRPADKKFTAWFEVNDITPFVVDKLNAGAAQQQGTSNNFIKQFTNYIKEVLADVPDSVTTTVSADPKKKQRRRTNW